MTRTWRRIIVAALFICSTAAEGRADHARPCEREMARAARSFMAFRSACCMRSA